MAINEVYVDPSIAGDSGAGSVGSPYGDLEWALEQTTPDAGGDRFNIKAGTDEILEFALDVVTDYGTPTETAPLIFRGYTAAAADGGIGGISGGGSGSIINLTGIDFVHFHDLHLHNSGSLRLFNIDQECSLINCELDNSTYSGANSVEMGNTSFIYGCYFHNLPGKCQFSGNTSVYNCYFKNDGANDFGTALSLTTGRACNNIIDIDGASNGILADGDDGTHIINNSVYSNGGTGTGILSASGANTHIITNNLVEGFSGAGGIGISIVTSTIIYGGNSVYNNETEYVAASAYILHNGGVDNETLSASPFNSASTGDFSPVDTGAVKEGSIPPNIGNGLT